MGKRNNQGLITASLIAGVSRLPAQMLINGSSEDPVFRYKGGDATTSGWSAWTYGEDLSYTAGGITVDQGSPCVADKAVEASGGAGRFGTSTTSIYDITTEDFVIEIVLMPTSDSETWMAKLDGNPVGWQVGKMPTNTLRLLVDDGPNNAQVKTANSSITANAWYHALCFVDRSGSGQWYLNGVASGSAVDVSSVGSLSNSVGFAFFSNDYGSSAGSPTGRLAYAAMWKKASWLDTHIQPAIARERFSLYTGNTSLHNHGDSTPVLL